MNNDLLTFCSIDESGVAFDDQKHRLTDPDVVEEFFAELKVNESFQITSLLHGKPVIIEAFDAPIVAQQILLSPTSNSLANIYGLEWEFDLSTLVVDEWDRFHGMTTSGLPFVLSAKAQDQFFDQLDEFSDETVTYNKKTYSTGTYWSDDVDVEAEKFWTDKYLNNEAGWDLGGPAAGLKALLPKLKLPSSRIVVLGGGGGHDAAFFAEQGHHVTLVDISAEAIALAKKHYGHLTNLNLVQGDLFDLPRDMYGQFDLVFEHTCYCAINPSLRDDLVRQWRRLLNDNGFLFAVLFAMPKRVGPPFGGSEWEIRQRLQKGFQIVIWQRFRQSIKPRLGRELIIYAQKKLTT